MATLKEQRQSADLEKLEQVRSNPDLLLQPEYANAVMRLANEGDQEALQIYLSFAENKLQDRSLKVGMALNYLKLRKWFLTPVRNRFAQHLPRDANFFETFGSLDLTEFHERARNIGRIYLAKGVLGLKKILPADVFSKLMETWPNHFKQPHDDEG